MKIRSLIFIVFLSIVLIVLGLILYKSRQLLDLALMSAKEYIPTSLPSDTTRLFEYDGYIKSDPVFIYVQGGPGWKLEDRELSPLLLIPQSGRHLKVYPYQAQIINQTIFPAKPELTEAQAQREVTVSAEILFRTISYFKNRNRKVYVLCVSHGSQIGLEMLSNKVNIADKIALAVIRLDIESEAIELTKEGKIPHYDRNHNLTSSYLLPSFLRIPLLNRKINNMSMLFKVARNRYTKLLKEKDLSNVIYIYANDDEKVGPPTSFEIEFLRSKETNILEFEGGHDCLRNKKYVEIIFDLLIE